MKCGRRLPKRDANCSEHWPVSHRNSSQGQADAAKQILKARESTQGVHAGIDVEVEQPVGAIFAGFLEIFDGAVLLSEANMNSGQVVRRDVLLPGEFCQIVENLVCSCLLTG